MKTGLPTEPTLIGRENEIKQLIEYLDSAKGGKGATVLISGEAGVGKTRLVKEFLNHAEKKGAKILSGWCLSEAAIPYFPFTEAFNNYMSTISDERTKSTMTRHMGITGWLRGPKFARAQIARESKPEFLSTPEIERDRTFEAATRVLLQLSAQEPTVLFLDDLHWADHLSLALLHYMSRKCRDSHLLIIGTYRPEELIQTVEERHHPLEETMFSMSREDLMTRIELNPLKRRDFPELLRSVFDSSIDEKFVERLYKETEGNPLFALETLNLLMDEGTLSQKGSRWMLTAPIEEIKMPTKVHEVIVRRIGRLGREDRNLLNLAAVCGRSFSPDTLSRTLASDIVDIVQTLYEIEQRHRLIRHEDSMFEFTHHQIREVIYTDLPGELRRIYHVKTAGCLEQVLAEKISDSYLADIAHHYVEGGVPEKAFEYLLRLGEKAVNIYANIQAIEYLSKALEATQRDHTLASKEKLGRIYKLRGRAWMGRGEGQRAVDDFKLSLQFTDSLTDESMIAEAHYWLGNSLAWAGKLDEAMPSLTKALEMARKIGNKNIECRSLYDLTLPLIASLDTIEEAPTGLNESSKICEEIGDKVLESHNAFWLGIYYNFRGEFSTAIQNLNKAVELTEETGDNFYRLFSLFILGMAKAGSGEFNEAILTLERCLQLAKDNGIMYFVPRTQNALGWIYHDLSDMERAILYNKRALETAKVHIALPPSLLNLGADYLYKGNYEDAKRYFQEAKSVLHLHQCVQWRYELKVLAGLGEVSLAEGDYTEALKLADDALIISQKAVAKKHIAKCLKLKSEIQEKMGNTEEAIKLMQDALNLSKQIGYPPLMWQIHHGLGMLLEGQGETQRAKEHHAEAMTLIEATASKLDDASLKNSLLTSPETEAIRARA